MDFIFPYRSSSKFFHGWLYAPIKGSALFPFCLSWSFFVIDLQKKGKSKKGKENKKQYQQGLRKKKKDFLESDDVDGGY